MRRKDNGSARTHIKHVQLCVHKVYSEERAISKWFHLGKKRRDAFVTYQCPKCHGWRVVSYALYWRLKDEEKEQKKERKQARVNEHRRTQAALKRTQAAAARLICPKCETRLQPHLFEQDKKYAYMWCANCQTIAYSFKVKTRRQSKRAKALELGVSAHCPTCKQVNCICVQWNSPVARMKNGLPLGPTRKHKFSKRPRRAAVELAKETMSQLKPEWALTPGQWQGWEELSRLSRAEGRIPTGGILLARQKLGPFDKLPRAIQLCILALGVNWPRTKHGRIPLGEALMWKVKRTKRETQQGLPARTFYDALTGYAVNRYGETRGKEYAQSVTVWVLEHSDRDLRRSKFHFQADKRKAHRVRRVKIDKPNRFRKFTTRSLKHYWAWLVSALKTVAKHEGNLPENVVVLPFNEDMPAERPAIRRTAKKQTEQGDRN